MSYSPGGEAPPPEGLHCLTSSWGKPPWLGWGCSRASFADWPDKPHPRNQEKDYILQFLCAPEVSPVLLVTREGGYQTSKSAHWRVGEQNTPLEVRVVQASASRWVHCIDEVTDPQRIVRFGRKQTRTWPPAF